MKSTAMALLSRTLSLAFIGNEVAINGYTSLVASDVDASSFITFADLTEDTVTGWLDTANSVRLSDYNAKINTKIAKAGETTRAVPWS
jgi:hypothetical protein